MNKTQDIETKAVFYVYEHWRPDKNQPFYVGKGKGKRAWELGRKQNKYYARIEAKLASIGLCIEVRLIVGELLEADAYALEKERIAFWRSQGISLANLTDGGEGFSDPTGEVAAKISKTLTGRKNGPPSDEVREKIRAAQIGNKPKPQTIEAVRHSNKTRPITEQFRKKMSLIHTGRKNGPCPSEVRAKIGIANTDPSESTRAKMRAAKAGVRWITNGVDSRFLRPGETIPSGWRLGRTLARKSTPELV